MAGQEVAQREAGTVEGIPAALLAQIEDAVAAIPDENGSGGEKIIAQLLAATSIDDLNKPWAGTPGRDLAGRTLVIRSLIKRDSEFADGPSIFLVVEATDAKTGEALTFTTSAIAVVIQLAQAYRLGMLPLTAEVVTARKPTKAGYLPYHLNVVGGNVPPRP